MKNLLALTFLLGTMITSLFGQTHSINGYFYYNNLANTPMDNVKVVLKLNGTGIDSTFTGETGFYQFTGVNNNTYSIAAYTSKPWGGVNATDALLVEHHFAGIEYLTVPVRITAADVNNSTAINGTDALKIKRRFIGLDSSFTRGNWTFEKLTGGNAIVVSGTNVTQNFYALCVGDVNGNYVPEPSATFSCGQQYTDTRDGKTYNTVQIGTQCWFKENLNVGVRIDRVDLQLNNGVIEKYCFDDLESNCDVYGGLYYWAETVQYLNGATDGNSWDPVPTGNVTGICPTGWHIPTDPEWTALTTFLGGENVAGGKMKEAGTAHWSPPNGGATNESGFTALPAGTTMNYGFAYLHTNTYWWSSTECSTGGAINRYTYSAWGTIYNICWSKGQGISVRCLKN